MNFLGTTWIAEYFLEIDHVGHFVGYFPSYSFQQWSHAFISVVISTNYPHHSLMKKQTSVQPIEIVQKRRGTEGIHHRRQSVLDGCKVSVSYVLEVSLQSCEKFHVFFCLIV